MFAQKHNFTFQGAILTNIQKSTRGAIPQSGLKVPTFQYDGSTLRKLRARSTGGDPLVHSACAAGNTHDSSLNLPFRQPSLHNFCENKITCATSVAKLSRRATLDFKIL